MSKNQQANVIYLTIIRDSMSEVVENCEEFEDTKAKGVIRSCKSKKDKQRSNV